MCFLFIFLQLFKFVCAVDALSRCAQISVEYTALWKDFYLYTANMAEIRVYGNKRFTEGVCSFTQ